MSDDNGNSSGARDRADDLVGTAREILGNNRRMAYLSGVALLIAWWAGWIPESPLPSWWPVALVVVGAAAGAGYIGGQKVLDLFPDEDGNLILDFENEEVYEVSDDKLASTRVSGTLYQWSETKVDVYEAVKYAPDANWALANWKESFPDTEINAEHTPSDAMRTIEEYREEFEPELAEARQLKRKIRSIVRRLDKQRGKAQAEILDEHTAPTVGDDLTITDVLEDELPEDLHPRAGDLSAPETDPNVDPEHIDFGLDDEDENGDHPDIGVEEAWQKIGDLDIEEINV